MADDPHGLSVIKVDKENHDTTSLYFAGPDVDKFKNRSAGQFATIRVFQNGAWSAPHPFTLSCAPDDATLRMTIKKSGDFTSTVPDIEPGTPIQCAGPFGQFCKNIDEKQRIVMIAGGVGITPFLSVLRHFQDIHAKNEVLLFWANKTLDDAFARQELETLTKELKLCVVHVLSRAKPQDVPEPQSTQSLGCVVQEFGRLNQEVLARHLRTTDAAFYLCGPPPMQEAVLAELEKCGVQAKNVEQEAFVFGKS
jgi:Predicted ferric reductase